MVTDHKPLVGICNNTEPSNNSHLKWVTTLSALQVKIQFEEERKNVIADALSRMDTMKKMEELEKVMKWYSSLKILKISSIVELSK